VDLLLMIAIGAAIIMVAAAIYLCINDD